MGHALSCRSLRSLFRRFTPRNTLSPTLGHDGMCFTWWRTIGMSHSSMSAAKKRAAMSVHPKRVFMLCAINPSTMPSIICAKSMPWLAVAFADSLTLSIYPEQRAKPSAM